MLIVAHRGASRDAPENTHAAFELAWSQAADAIECDLRLTADDEIVALHDATLTRTTGHRASLRTRSLAQVRELDAGRWFGPAFTGCRVPTLAEILNTAPARKHLVLELKDPAPLPALLPPILATRPDLAVTLIAFDYETLAATKEVLPHLPALWLLERLPGDILARLQQARLDGIDLRYRSSITPQQLAPLHEAAATLYTYTVNSPTSARRCQSLGFHALTTDTPRTIRHSLNHQTNQNSEINNR